MTLGLCPRQDFVPGAGSLIGPATVRVPTQPAIDATEQPASSVPPSAIDEFCRARPEFELIGQLGEGAFARVYLARQHNLGSRLVALKVSSEEVGEAQLLARLLHTNIVPIYSTHTLGYFHAVCMPYLGSTTLADLIRTFRETGLPASGRQLVSTLKSQRHTRKTDHGRPDSEAEQLAWPGDDLPILPPSTQATLDCYAEMSYVESVVWIAQQLADGLAHAHERGIIHRDIKPANVLLTDDGTPMLLDFNLAEDTGSTDQSGPGGTLPYAAPEVLRRILGDDNAPCGAHSDLYSLGLILFELLSGRLHGTSAVKSGLVQFTRQLAEMRSGPVPPLRELNPAVSPALESIVRHCLEPHPKNRYQSARELQEDLKRQRDNRPLRYAPDPSLLERGRKWAKRHPRLAALVVTAMIGITTCTALATAMNSYRAWALRLDAERSLEQLTQRAAETTYCLAGQSLDEARTAADRARDALAPYQALEDPHWHQRPKARSLSPEKQEQLKATVGSLLLVMARGEAEALGTAHAIETTEDGQKRLRAALALNAQAAETGEKHLAHAVLAQKAALLQMQGAPEAKQVRQQAEREPLRGPADAAMTGRDLVVSGQHREALPFLLEATKQTPEDTASWFLLGRCQEALAQERYAIEAYSTVLGQRPRNGLVHFRRGLAYLRKNDNPQAVDDFRQAIELGHAPADAHLNAGLALHRMGRFAEAIEEIDRAFALNAPYTRLHFIRARFRDDAGDRAGAKRDRAEGLAREPSDEMSWLARGLARLGSDDRGALADFQKVIDLNPRSLPGLVNAAHVLAERLNRQEDALKLLDRATQAQPEHQAARATRAVVLARLGRRDEAIREAQALLIAAREPAVVFQMAALYAQTSAVEAKDRDEAFRLLKLALRRGYGHDQLTTDRDLVPLRSTTEYKRLLGVVQGLR